MLHSMLVVSAVSTDDCVIVHAMITAATAIAAAVGGGVTDHCV